MPDGALVPTSQFGTPRGARGWVAAQVVSRLTADANRWMVECLEVERYDRVLDVGCGPGHGVGLAARLATGGFVVGVDASATMVRQARRRNRVARRDGRVEVTMADAARMPYPDHNFDKAWSLNSLQFWTDPGHGVREMRRVVTPGGRLAIALMARSDDPPGGGPPRWLAAIAELMEDSGFGTVGCRKRTFGGVVHWALLSASTGTVPVR